MSNFCIKCGAPLKADAQFCSTCGTKVLKNLTLSEIKIIDIADKIINIGM